MSFKGSRIVQGGGNTYRLQGPEISDGIIKVQKSEISDGVTIKKVTFLLMKRPLFIFGNTYKHIIGPILCFLLRVRLYIILLQSN